MLINYKDLTTDQKYFILEAIRNPPDRYKLKDELEAKLKSLFAFPEDGKLTVEYPANWHDPIKFPDPEHPFAHMNFLNVEALEAKS